MLRQLVHIGKAPATIPARDIPPKTSLLGLNISLLTSKVLFETVAKAVRERTALRVAFCSVDTVVQSQRNSELARAVNEFEVASPDGMPLVWLNSLHGHRGIERVDGPNSMLSICEQGVPLDFKHYFYGGTGEMLEVLERSLLDRFPGIQIVGSHSPPFRRLTEEERLEDVHRINAAKPDLLWVGLGMPKQEIWVASNHAMLESPVILAVGAAFGFTAGVVRRAPRWMQRTGLEWAFRLSQEPRRLWRRYLLGNPYFVWIVAKDWVQRVARNKSI